ncbi:MAG: hypothetical protein ABW252_03695 [Polyangiales bacterium]
MMRADESTRLDRLYQLLPAVHRLQDAKQGEALRALLRVIAAQMNLIEEDITDLYDNWFIETCAPWVVPYLGALVGWQAVEPGAVHDASGHDAGRSLPLRRDVANTVRSRRRKGTLALLEELAMDVSGWSSRAVEYTRLALVTPAIDHPSSWDRRTVDLRDPDALAAHGGAFEALAHTPDVRRIQARPAGRHNLPSVGLHVFRLGAYSVARTKACCLEEVGPSWYAFSALGNDTPLFARPLPEPDATHVAGPRNVPHPIGRHELARTLAAAPGASYYGLASDGVTGQSFAIWADAWPEKNNDGQAPIPASSIDVADLSDFRYAPARDRVAVDPVLGRIAFPPRQLPKHVWVSYHYGFTAPLGGGAYPRTVRAPADAVVVRVQGQEQLRRALEPWRRVHEEDGKPGDAPPRAAVIEIADSGVYVVPIQVHLPADHALQLRAAPGTRPLIRLLDWQTDRPDSLLVSGAAGSRFSLDGMMVAGRGLRVEGELRSLTIRHSTLVPGWSLEPSCAPRRAAEASIELVGRHGCVVIDHSIVGSLQIDTHEVTTDPVVVRIHDSIVDAASDDDARAEGEAIGAAGAGRAHATLEVLRSTVLGKVHVHAIALAEDSIFTGCISVARRQIGCVRFCSVTPCSRTPRRHRCQPDEAERAAVEALREGTPSVDDARVRAERVAARRAVRPRFDSVRYGHPAYGRLSADCADAIARGAEDGSEMGVFHDVRQPQRLANLAARLSEYVPAATDVAILLAT